MKRVGLFIGVVLGGLLMGLLVFLNTIRSTQELTIVINPQEPTLVQIYKMNTSHNNWSTTEKPIAQTSKTQTFSLKKGQYGILAQKTDTTLQQTTTVLLGDQPETVTIIPKYTEAKLQAMLDEQKSAIRSSVKQSYPSLQTGYYFDGEQLVGQGDWYVARVASNSLTDSFGYADNYFVIMKKNNGVWKKAIGSPTLIINKSENPELPDYVLKAANSYYN